MEKQIEIDTPGIYILSPLMAENPPCSPARYRSLRIQHWCAVAFCIAGIICMITGAAFAALRWYHHRKMITTNAKITAYEESKGADGKVVYLPLYEFPGPTGEVIFGNSAATPAPPDELIGTTIEVIYDPRSPEKSVLKDSYSLWGNTWVPGIAGACVFSLFTLRLFQTRYRLKKLETLPLEKDTMPR